MKDTVSFWAYLQVQAIDIVFNLQKWWRFINHFRVNSISLALTFSLWGGTRISQLISSAPEHAINVQVITTISQGRIVWDGREILAKEGDGRYIKTPAFGNLYTGLDTQDKSYLQRKFPYGTIPVDRTPKAVPGKTELWCIQGKPDWSPSVEFCVFFWSKMQRESVLHTYKCTCWLGKSCTLFSLSYGFRTLCSCHASALNRRRVICQHNKWDD